MRTRKFNWIQSPFLMACWLVLAFVAACPAFSAQPDQLLHSFQKAAGDDHSPQGLARDAAGNLYGTTSFGLDGQAGDVFELSPLQGGGWTFKELHKFRFDTTDGAYPSGPLTMDLEGNFYGVTLEGGNGACTDGCGVVYELSPNGGGGWKEKVLYDFQGINIDGIGPRGSVTLDSAGNIYGTTEAGGIGGGTLGGGTVYMLSPRSGGAWREDVLYSFSYPGQTGYYPYGGVILDPSGNLYGTTAYGGNDTVL